MAHPKRRRSTADGTADESRRRPCAPWSTGWPTPGPGRASGTRPSCTPPPGSPSRSATPPPPCPAPVHWPPPTSPPPPILPFQNLAVKSNLSPVPQSVGSIKIRKMYSRLRLYHPPPDWTKVADISGWMIKPVRPNSSSKCQLYCAKQPNRWCRVALLHCLDLGHVSRAWACPPHRNFFFPSRQTCPFAIRAICATRKARKSGR